MFQPVYFLLAHGAYALLIYVFYALPLFVIAYKSAHPLAFLAFIPFANLWLMCDLADVSPAWILANLVPEIGFFVFTALVYWQISESTNKPGWLGLLMVIPGVNLIVGYYMAFGDSGQFIA